MLVTQLVAMAIVDGTRVSIQGNLAAAKEQDKDAEATGEPVPETSLPTTSTASITTTMTRGQPPAISLIRAAIDGDVAALAQHRQAGTDLNATLDLDRWTAAHFAAWQGHVAALKFLHEAGADLSATNILGNTPAYLAAAYGHAEALEALAKAGADLDTPNIERKTPAYAAAQRGKTDALRILIKAGADIDTAAGNGRTLAHWAAADRDGLDALRLLIQAGVDLNVTDMWGDTPADVAADFWHQEALKMILEAGGKRSKP